MPMKLPEAERPKLIRELKTWLADEPDAQRDWLFTNISIRELRRLTRTVMPSQRRQSEGSGRVTGRDS